MKMTTGSTEEVPKMMMMILGLVGVTKTRVD